jgi:hypothetical protein
MKGHGRVAIQILLSSRRCLDMKELSCARVIGYVVEFFRPEPWPVFAVV